MCLYLSELYPHQPYEPSASERHMIEWIATHNGLKADLLDTKFQTAVGCEQCKNGYKGRVGLYETLVLDEQVRALFNNGSPAEAELWRAANAGGTISLEFNFIKKVSRGMTTLDEFYRVTGFSSDDWNQDSAPA